MKQFVFSVYDSKAKVFCKPFFCINTAVAVRAFAGAANDQEQEMGRHPEDFTLHQVAEFDDQTGVVYPLPQHVNHGLATQFVVRATGFQKE